MVTNRKIGKLSDFSGVNIVLPCFINKYDNIVSEIKDVFNSALEMKDFTGKSDQISIFYSNSKKYFVLGLGEEDKVTSERIRRSFGALGSKLREFKITSVVIDLSMITEKIHIEAAIEGALLGNYRFTSFKSDDKDNQTALQEVFYLNQSADFGTNLAFAEANVEGTILVRELGNMPSNIMTPTYLAEEAKKLSDAGITVKVLDKDEILQEKMGLFEGVFKGSAHADPPKFIILDYKPETYTKTLVLVGKAITFDSGGISIKGSENMGDMKFDMLGGGVVIGSLKAISLIKPQNIRIIGLIPSTPNLPDAFSYRPGDILTARNGKMVEVINTDAEGRMLLADALSYAQDYKPDLVFDFATLTGAIMVGLGAVNAAFYLNDKSESLNIKDTIFTAGRNTGDYVWHMPLDEEYFDQLKSNYADFKHVGGRLGGSITAAMFLKQFTDYPWVHFDIAGTGWTGGNTGKGLNYNAQTGATGFGVRLVLDFIRNWN